MSAFYGYLLKVLLCSGLFYTYYFFALRNRKLHRYNRFYLLSASALSWIIPVLRIDFDRAHFQQPHVIKLLEIVSGGSYFFEETAVGHRTGWEWNGFIGVVFLFVSAIFLFRVLLSLCRLVLLVRGNPKERRGGAWLVYSGTKGTPFSFFHYIFWDPFIDTESTEGRHILAHELTHVYQGHSADKLFLNLSMVAGWCNPFAWLVLQELNMTHEFLADEKAVDTGDMPSFAAMLLKTTYPGIEPPDLAHPFFHTPVKRRFLMLARPPVNHPVLRRLGILPLLALVVGLFAFRIHDTSYSPPVAGGALTRDYTLIVDAGHGGWDAGVTDDLLREKDVNLRIARQVKELNRDPHLNILLTRAGDDYLSPRERVAYTDLHRADVFISIHTNRVESVRAGESTESGRSSGSGRSGESRESGGPDGACIFLSKKENRFKRDSRGLANCLAEKLQDPFHGDIRLATQTGTITVLEANNTCPAVLVECGFLRKEADTEPVFGPERTTKIANRILEAAEQYLATLK